VTVSQIFLSVLLNILFNIGIAQHEKLLGAGSTVSIWKTEQGQLFLLTDKAERKTLFTDKTAISAVFLNSDHILITRWKRKSIVVDLEGAVRYKLPGYVYADYIPDRTGARFAVYERGKSISHQLNEGSYNRMRVVVFSTNDGKKLLEYKWSASKSEDVRGFGVRFSDDGTTLYVDRATRKLVLPIP